MAQYDPISSSEFLLEGFQEQLRNEWSSYRNKYFNKNKKGETYEQALIELLEQYFGGLYDFYNRVALLDDDLMNTAIFTPDQNEFDVVALYKQSVPNIVIEAGSMQWVPYSGVSFLCEVKSRPNKQAVRDDLEKIGMLRISEPDAADRFVANMYSFGHVVNRPLYCLVYDRSDNVADETLISELENNLQAWDVALFVEEDQIFVNESLPFSGSFFIDQENELLDIYKDDFKAALIEAYEEKATKHDGLVSGDYGLLRFLYLLSNSIPQSPAVRTVKPIANIMFYGIMGEAMERSDSEDISTALDPEYLEQITNLLDIPEEEFDSE